MPFMRNNRGMTLIETVGAVLIIGISVGSIFGAVIVGKYALTRAKHRVAVMNFITSKIEQVMADSYVGVIAGSYLEDVTIDDYGTVDNSDDLIGQLQTDIEDLEGGGYKKVLATINWTEKGWGGSSDLAENVVTYLTQE